MVMMICLASARRPGRPGGARPNFTDLECDNGDLPDCADRHGNPGVWVCRTRPRKNSEDSEGEYKIKTKCVNPERSIEGLDECGVCDEDETPTVAVCPDECKCRDDGFKLSYTKKNGKTKTRCFSLERATAILYSREKVECCSSSTSEDEDSTTTTTTATVTTTEAA